MHIIIFTILIILSGFFSSTETAFFSLHSGQIRLMQQKKRKNARIIAKMKHDSQRLLITILIGNNIVNLFTASLATVVAGQYFDSAAIGIATGVTTLFILIFGEIVPKSIAITHAEYLAQLVAKPVYALYIVFYPISTLLMKLNHFLSKLFGGQKKTLAVTEEEIRVMARMGVESGEIEYREREMIENIFRFDDIEVGDVMTPLYKVELLNGMVPVSQIAYFVANSRHSRFPVYDDNDTDDIIGYIHTNTILQVLNSDKRDKLVKDFISPITRIEETTKIERIFRSMKSSKNHMYMVHREGDEEDIIGLVTLEDLLEEIVGEIEDETDHIGKEVEK
jgi:putative hemolysin